ILRVLVDAISISDAHRVLGSRHNHGTVRLTSDLRWAKDSSSIDSSEQQRRQYRERIHTSNLRHSNGRPTRTSN
ncbi:hypothetical protein PFISCL1PPCAC_13421, partial [Pristionchus fissidentatus]